MNDSEWTPIDGTPIRDLIGERTFELPNGNHKRIGGDVHHTVDLNPKSPTFGEVHSTLRIPGLSDFHSS